ncbi:hypothetical protein MIPYR_20022 [uncultured Microbacterium sp.]|uniref:Uncharacterized protein n=1 Tax=uncultured Microbacterium sp. TaxID=191216 RepID=A0A1Y5NYN2_9MICO|nr:hypothetical protein MIPYR_20022 [uncultured Microbacterium sp.]
MDSTKPTNSPRRLPTTSPSSTGAQVTIGSESSSAVLMGASLGRCGRVRVSHMDWYLNW